MSRTRLPSVSVLKTQCAQGDALIEFYPFADVGRLADNHARAVIDEKILADIRAGMDVDARLAVRPLGHHARYERHGKLVQQMGQPVNGDGLQARIAENHFVQRLAGRIAGISGLDVHCQNFAKVGQLLQKSHGLCLADGLEVLESSLDCTAIFSRPRASAPGRFAASGYRACGRSIRQRDTSHCQGANRRAAGSRDREPPSNPRSPRRPYRNWATGNDPSDEYYSPRRTYRLSVRSTAAGFLLSEDRWPCCRARVRVYVGSSKSRNNFSRALTSQGFSLILPRVARQR